MKLAPVKAPVTISGDISSKPLSLSFSHFFLFLTLSLLYWNRFCLDRDCVFVCVHVCAAVVKGFSNVIYYLFKLPNMSEASQFFAYGSKGQSLCWNSKVTFKYVSLNWSYIMLGMGLLLSAWEGSERGFDRDLAQRHKTSHNSHTHALPAAVTLVCLANHSFFSKSVFLHVKRTCSV